MWNPLKKKKKEETVLIFDIGSGSVGGAFVELSPDMEPKILYSTRKEITFQKNLQGARFKKEMYKALGLVLKNLDQNSVTALGGYSKKKIDKALCSLASPWFVSDTTSIKISDKEPFRITEDLLADIIAKEEENFENSNLAKYGLQKIQDSETIERKIVDIKLNGYKTKEPIGKQTQKAEISIFMSMSQTSVLDGIENLILRSFYVDEIIFHSFTLVSFAAMRDMYSRVSSFLFLDITGEVTDVSLVKNNNIMKTVSFPLGKNSVIRKLSEDLKIEPNEARSNLKLLFNNSLSSGKRELLTEKVEASRALWLEEFQKSLNTLSGGLALPTTVFFTADEDISAWYGEVIKEEKYAQHAITEGSFIVSFVNSPSIDSYVKFAEKGAKDTFLGIISLFFKRVFELDS